MIQLLYLSFDIAALGVLCASFYCFGVATGLGAVKKDAARLVAGVTALHAAHEEFSKHAIETIEFQRTTIAEQQFVIDALTAPTESLELDPPHNFN